MSGSLSSTVLVVDDEKTVTDVLLVLLKRAALPAMAAASAGEALRLMSAHQFGCLLVDKNLPDQSGLEVIAEMKHRQPYCACLVMTGFPSYESTLAALRMGASDYLEKPFSDINLVVQKVEQQLKHQQIEFERDQFAAALRDMRNQMKRRDELLVRQQSDLQLLQQMIDAKVDDRTRELTEAVKRLEEELRAMKTPAAS